MSRTPVNRKSRSHHGWMNEITERERTKRISERNFFVKKFLFVCFVVCCFSFQRIQNEYIFELEWSKLAGHFLYLPVDPTMENMVVKSPPFRGLWEFCKVSKVTKLLSQKKLKMCVLLSRRYNPVNIGRADIDCSAIYTTTRHGQSWIGAGQLLHLKTTNLS